MNADLSTFSDSLFSWYSGMLVKEATKQDSTRPHSVRIASEISLPASAPALASFLHQL